MNRYEIDQILSNQKAEINHLIQQFLCEQAEFSNEQPNQHGFFDCQYLLLEQHDFFLIKEIVVKEALVKETGVQDNRIKASENVIGFAIKADNAGTHDLVACFIAKEHRLQGLGSRLIHHVFRRYNGDWQVKQLEDDQAAQRFFRQVLASFQSGFFEEQLIGDPCDGLVNQQTFFVADCQ
jgi:predicted acetyltransferase